ncbi:hypothetical protein GF412_04680 [Candidatus Micrarchaeota archaeon]|nr:hypothetical protein [Candidatus Micrarchaeota archaeon]MBD3418248.1 hypothetical protein [Candidatus Micrarchaeota archaeon]
MSGSGVSGRERMAQVIRSAIADPEVLDSVSEQDAMQIAEKAVHLLHPSEVRSFIFQCFRLGKVENGLAMLDATIEYSSKMRRHGDWKMGSGALVAAVSAIAAISTSNRSAREKLFRVLEYGEPDVVATVVKSLGRSNEIRSFRKVCDLILKDEFKVQMSAVRYAEDCAMKAAFLKRDEDYAMEPTAEEFMRNALVSLERIHEKLLERGGGHIQRRLAILVAMSYNEILDTIDWKRRNEEDVNEVIYYNLEEHLHKRLAPEALPLLFKMLQRAGLDESVKKCALNTIGRIGNNEKCRGRVRAWARDYIGLEKSPRLTKIAMQIRESCMHGKRFSSIPAPVRARGRTSIIPKGVGPIKR